MTRVKIVKEKYSAVFNSAVADKNRRIAEIKTPQKLPAIRYYAVSNMKSIVFKRCVCHIIVIMFRELRNFSTYCHPGQDQNATVEPCTPPPPPPPPRSLKWPAQMKAPRWKGHRKYGLYSQFDSHKPEQCKLLTQSHDRSIHVPVSREVQKYWHMASLYSYFQDRSALGEFGKDNSHVPYCQFKRLLYFICHKHVYFRMCFLSNQAHRLCCGAYFQVRVLAHIDHTFVSIASLFAAIKIYIFKNKVIRVKSIFIKLNWLHN